MFRYFRVEVLAVVGGDVKVVDEKHYQLVAASSISIEDLQQYSNRI